MRETKSYLGLELAGAKNEKSALAVLEYYPKERKIFLLDTFEKISAHEDQTGDEALLEILDELKTGVSRMGVNVPLSLPPCITCTRASCPMPSKCNVPAVKYMRELTRKVGRSGKAQNKLKTFTPYTQRPIELYIRHQIGPEIDGGVSFDIDETLGGTKAPLTARMNFLKRHLGDLGLVEVWPKLTVAILSEQIGVPRRVLERYRHLEQGIHARSELLEALAREHGIFIYERDLRKLSQSLSTFDAFICAYTALLSDNSHCAKVPAGFPGTSGWAEFPKTEG